MRDPLNVVVAVLFVAVFVLLMFALYCGNSKPETHAQLHNAYWPYSVETAIKDK